MGKILATLTLPGALALAASAATPAPPPAASPVAELGGRAPGTPQRCLGVAPGGMFTTSGSDPRLLLYDDGRTLWASRLDSRCGFDVNQPAIPDAPASYYCQGDFVRAGSRITLLPLGRTCALGTFTPYR